jgi:hypothetical protein
MKKIIKASREPRKPWAAPELKKIDVEQLTAAGGGRKVDGNIHGS